MVLRDAKSQQDVDTASSSGQPAVLHFWASWCEPCKHMDTVLAQLAKDHPGISFLRVEAEAVDDVTIKYEVAMVPSFVLLKGGAVVDRLEGADAAALTSKVTAFASGRSATAAAPAATSAAAGGAVANGAASHQDVAGRIKWLLSQHPVLLFMKGTADAPSCGFSGKVVAALKALQVPFKTVDILDDEPLRNGLKAFSNWPTYPQLYVKGELVGGCDIVMQMHGSGELATLLAEKLGPNYQSSVPPSAIKTSATTGVGAAPAAAAAPAPPESKEALTARIKQLVNAQPVVLFMKGNPAEPRCGFSRKVVDALASIGVKHGHFDILSDQAVREGLKEYSNWPTYPQLYVNGELLGGCDIVLEMQASGELKSTIESELAKAKEALTARIKQLVCAQPVVLFMKGSPDAPRCGFSRKVVDALKGINTEFGHFDILSDQAVREGLKEYSNWPTYPQLYVNGELLGGCDIVLQMQEAGELKTTVDEMLHRMDTV